MKLTLMFLLVGALQLSASVHAQNGKLNVQIENMKLSDLLWQLQEESGVVFIYQTDDVKEVKDISVDLLAASITDILNEVLEGTDLDYAVDDEVVVIKKKEIIPIPAVEKKQQEKKTIKGKVTDKDGIPLPGVSVVIKGTSTGVATDIDGNYSIELESNNAILVFSFVGMMPVEIVFNGQSVQNVTLNSNSEQMAEVVITGYQTISKERATGAFGTINGEDISNKLNSDLTKVIEGITTGIVSDNEGNITIRGTSTFEAERQPLIVLDGFPYDGNLSSINADNIDNITILKDGVAASIYGARSANGVIVVTTKKGKKGDFKFSYKGTVSVIQKTDVDDLNRSSTSDYIDAQIAKFDSAPFYYYPSPRRMSHVDYLLVQAGYGAITRDAAMAEIDKLRSNNLYKDVEKYGLRNSFTHQHNINISGGGEKNLFNASVNYFDEKGEELMTENNRFIFDIKNTWRPNKHITFSTSANIVYRERENSKTSLFNLVSTGPWTYSNKLQPYDRIVDDNGNPVEDVDFYVSPSRESVYLSNPSMKPWHYSPLNDMHEGTDQANDLQARLSAQLNIDLMKGLSVLVGGAWTRGNSNYKGYYSADSHVMRIAYNDGTSVTDPTKHYMPEGALLDETRSINESFTFRAQVNFNRSFNDDRHRVTAIAGNEIRRDEFDNAVLPTKLGYNSISGDYIFVDNSTISPSYSSNANDYLFGRWDTMFPKISEGKLNYRDNRFVSWYGNGSYEYDNRFLVSASIRLDLTNFFGTDPKYRYKPTWSAGGTYKLSNEKWFDIDFIDRLNIRGSYGINGNISMTEGPFMILGSEGYSQKAQGVSYRINSPANNQLRWEKTSTTNIGLDIAMFNNRVNLSVDAYRKYSTDLLAPDAVDPTTGVSALAKNAGEITNRGIEVSLNAGVIKNKSFLYNTIVNASYNKSNVDKYNLNRSHPAYYLIWPFSINEAGYEMEGLWGFRGAPLSESGEARAYDAEGNAIHPNSLEVDDVIYLGTSIPKFNLAWTNTFNFKNFEASFMFVGSFGAKFWKDTFTGNNITNHNVSKAWKEPGDEAHTIYPKVSYFGSGWWYDKADYFVQSANYIKLRDVTLTYNVPKKILENIGCSSVKVFLQGRNLMTMKASGVDNDPETRGLPLKKEFYAGLSFEF